MCIANANYCISSEICRLQYVVKPLTSKTCPNSLAPDICWQAVKERVEGWAGVAEYNQPDFGANKAVQVPLLSWEIKNVLDYSRYFYGEVEQSEST